LLRAILFCRTSAENHEPIWDIKTVFSWTTFRTDDYANFTSRRNSAPCQIRNGCWSKFRHDAEIKWTLFVIPWELTGVIVMRYAWCNLFNKKNLIHEMIRLSLLTTITLGAFLCRAKLTEYFRHCGNLHSIEMKTDAAHGY
jgi:hypothetical protein